MSTTNARRAGDTSDNNNGGTILSLIALSYCERDIPYTFFLNCLTVHTMSSRKRSRWGTSSSDDNNNNSTNRRGSGDQQDGNAVTCVSDQEAVLALLSSATAAAAAATASSSSQPPQQKQQKGRGERGGGGRRGSGGPRHEKRSGGGGDGGGGVEGHYGPAQRGGEQRRNDYKQMNVGAARDVDSSKRSRWNSSASASATAGSGNGDSAAVAAAAANSAEAAAPAVVAKEKPNFGLSGALAKKDDGAGGGGGSNMYKGVLLKFREPPEARAPANTYWRLYVFKGKEELETLHIAKQSAYLIGRNADICDIVIQHPSAR
jgi:hypothetical protein